MRPLFSLASIPGAGPRRLEARDWMQYLASGCSGPGWMSSPLLGTHLITPESLPTHFWGPFPAEWGLDWMAMHHVCIS